MCGRRRRSSSRFCVSRRRRLAQMTKTLLEMSNLRQVARNEQLQLAPMVEGIFLRILRRWRRSERITLEAEGGRRPDRQRRADLPHALQPDGEHCQIQPPRRLGAGQGTGGRRKCIIRVSDTGCGISEYQRSISIPFFRVDKSRSLVRRRGTGLLWCGDVTPLTFGWRKARTRARPLRWSCQRNNQRSPNPLLFWSA